MDIIETIGIISGGLFAGTALTIAWDRLPVWKSMPLDVFRADFKRTVLIADVLQPLLLIVTMISLIVLGLQAGGAGRMLAFTAAGGYVIILLVSLAVLVPLQRKLFTLKQEELPLRLRWLKGHRGRTILSLVSFGLGAAAIALV